MPGYTPLYGFPYPCQGETITPASFTNLANAIDAKLLQVNADMVFALNRPNTDIPTTTTQVIPAGVDTVLTIPSSTYTVTVAGVYVFWIHTFSQVAPPTISAQRIRVRQNAVAKFGFTQDSDNNNTIDVRATGVIVAAAGDVISSTFLYTGTGTNTIQAELSVKLLCRIP